MIEILMAGLLGFILGWVSRSRSVVLRLAQQRATWQARADSTQAELTGLRKELRDLKTAMGVEDAPQEDPGLGTSAAADDKGTSGSRSETLEEPHLQNGAEATG